MIERVAFFYKHRGAREACKVDIRNPIRSAVSLWSSRWFAVGMGVAIGAWLLHVAAMALEYLRPFKRAPHECERHIEQHA